jgi:hypothetical protein
MRARRRFRYPRFMEFRVTEMNGEIIVANDDFRAVYYKPDKLDPQRLDVARLWERAPLRLKRPSAGDLAIVVQENFVAAKLTGDNRQPQPRI